MAMPALGPSFGNGARGNVHMDVALLEKCWIVAKGCGPVLQRCLPAPINRISLLTGVQARPVVTRGTLVRIVPLFLVLMVDVKQERYGRRV